MREVMPQLVVVESGKRTGQRTMRTGSCRHSVNRTGAPSSAQQALRDHERDQAEVGAAHHDVARQAAACEMLVDHAARAAECRRGATCSQPGTSRRSSRGPRHPHDRVVFGHQADDLVAHQLAQVQLSGRLEPIADDQVDLAGGQTAPIVRTRPTAAEARAASAAPPSQMRHQLGQEERIE